MKRALIVVDVQNEHVRGEFAITHPSVHESMPNIAMAMDTAADLQVPTVVVCRVERPGSPHFAQDQPGSAIHSLIADNPRDATVITSGAAGDGEGDLAAWLRDRDVTVATLVGYTAEGAISRLATLLTASGLTVEVLEDSTGSHEQESDDLDARAVYERALDRLEHQESVIVGTAMDWEEAVREDRLVKRVRVGTAAENERPSRLRDEFERIEDRVRSLAEEGAATSEAFQLQHTFAVGVQPL